MISGKALTASSNLFNIIDRIPKIDNGSDQGQTPGPQAKGHLAFNNVRFRYESRPKVIIPILVATKLVGNLHVIGYET